jgi:hypothetical protein
MNQKEMLDLLRIAASPNCSHIEKLRVMEQLAANCSCKYFGFENDLVENEVSKKITEIVSKVYRDMMATNLASRITHLFPFFALACCEEDEINLSLLRSS